MTTGGPSGSGYLSLLVEVRRIASQATGAEAADAVLDELRESILEIERSLRDEQERRTHRQKKVSAWAREAFGVEEAMSLPQRGLRLLEEAVEAFQSCGGTEAKAVELVKFVFARPVGPLSGELGGVGVTLLALAAAAGLSADVAEEQEVQRVLSKPIAHFAERNRVKNEAGFRVVGVTVPAPREPTDAERVAFGAYVEREVFEAISSVVVAEARRLGLATGNRSLAEVTGAVLSKLRSLADDGARVSAERDMISILRDTVETTAAACGFPLGKFGLLAATRAVVEGFKRLDNEVTLARAERDEARLKSGVDDGVFAALREVIGSVVGSSDEGSPRVGLLAETRAVVDDLRTARRELQAVDGGGLLKVSAAEVVAGADWPGIEAAHRRAFDEVTAERDSLRQQVESLHRRATYAEESAARSAVEALANGGDRTATQELVFTLRETVDGAGDRGLSGRVGLVAATQAVVVRLLEVTRERDAALAALSEYQERSRRFALDVRRALDAKDHEDALAAATRVGVVAAIGLEVTVGRLTDEASARDLRIEEISRDLSIVRSILGIQSTLDVLTDTRVK